VVREFVGHGIGTKMHDEPNLPNYGEPGRGARLQEGMVIAVEPMVKRRPSGSGDARRVVGGNSRWKSFGAFRAHRGGYGERPVDSDAAERDDRAGVGERSLKY